MDSNGISKQNDTFKRENNEYFELFIAMDTLCIYFNAPKFIYGSVLITTNLIGSWVSCGETVIA